MGVHPLPSPLPLGRGDFGNVWAGWGAGISRNFPFCPVLVVFLRCPDTTWVVGGRFFGFGPISSHLVPWGYWGRLGWRIYVLIGHVLMLLEGGWFAKGLGGWWVGFLFGFWAGGVHPLPSPLPLGRGDFGCGGFGAFALALGLWFLGLGIPGLLGLLVGLRRGLLLVRCSRIGLLGSLWILAIWCVGRLGLAVAGGVRRRVLLLAVFGGIRSRRCRGLWVIGGGSSGDGGSDVGGGTRGFVRRRWGGGGGGGRWRWIGGVGAWLLFFWVGGGWVLLGCWLVGFHPLPSPLPLGRGDFASGAWDARW